MACVENVSDGELEPMDDEEEDGEIPVIPLKKELLEDVLLSDIRCAPSLWDILLQFISIKLFLIGWNNKSTSYCFGNLVLVALS